MVLWLLERTLLFSVEMETRGSQRPPYVRSATKPFTALQMPEVTGKALGMINVRTIFSFCLCAGQGLFVLFGSGEVLAIELRASHMLGQHYTNQH